MWIIWLRNTEKNAFYTAKWNNTDLGRKNTGQFCSMSDNALEVEKGPPGSGKYLYEYDFIMILQGK